MKGLFSSNQRLDIGHNQNRYTSEGPTTHFNDELQFEPRHFFPLFFCPGSLCTLSITSLFKAILHFAYIIITIRLGISIVANSADSTWLLVQCPAKFSSPALWVTPLQIGHRRRRSSRSYGPSENLAALHTFADDASPSEADDAVVADRPERPKRWAKLEVFAQLAWRRTASFFAFAKLSTTAKASAQSAESLREAEAAKNHRFLRCVVIS